MMVKAAGEPDAERDLSGSWNKIGDVAQAGRPEDALQAFSDAYDIAEKLARCDAANAQRQRDLSVGWSRIGDIRKAQSDVAGALQAYSEGLAVAAKLAARDTGNTGWQRDLAGLGQHWRRHAGAGRPGWRAAGFFGRSRHPPMAGGAGRRQHGLAARSIGETSGKRRAICLPPSGLFEQLRHCGKLPLRDPGNMDWQHDLIISHYKLAQAVDDPRGHYAKALEIAEAMEKKGMLVLSDAFIPGMLRQELAALK